MSTYKPKDGEASYTIAMQVRDTGECVCSTMLMPPCCFCTNLTEEEADIFANDGIEALRRYREDREGNLSASQDAHHTDQPAFLNGRLTERDAIVLDLRGEERRHNGEARAAIKAIADRLEAGRRHYLPRQATPAQPPPTREDAAPPAEQGACEKFSEHSKQGEDR